MKMLRTPAQFERRRRRSQRGASIVEFSLTIITVIFVFFLLFEFSLWVYCYNVMSDAAKAGVRYAIVHGSKAADGYRSGPDTPGSVLTSCTASSANVDSVVGEVEKWASFSAYPTASISVTVCYMDGSNTAPGRVQVKVSNPTTPFFSALWLTPPIKATAQGRIVF